ncbi:NAD(P)/FAD-dependent oxidoreductase [Microbulbifer halophilus]|uniref:NAD(P)/FAD-dependent oxidoreductase n=1 Tax=Microbulbifer halophilus TaxID=453963 RepID=A0ABW5EDH3_9GAMM|nr:NAD(P)/FAD-dependent oxidoreductase [Microbulbifer halophilus]MCW8127876.1 NAD(P)/FAD-dependent oxidoreductase [Microbulbifer halophilus]
MAIHDVLIVGGSYAGMAAALQLTRARRSVLVLDAGQRRNRFAKHAHGIPGQDGRPPSAIAEDARAQLLKYPTVTWLDATARSAGCDGDTFHIQTETGESFEARRLILANGVRDQLPDLPGLAERWGRSVFHCPYCHGYELNEGPIGVLGVNAMSVHQALMLPDWGPTTLFTNGIVEPDAEELRQLAARNVSIEVEPVAELAGEGEAIVRLRDGRAVELAGLFLVPTLEPASPLAEQLGCAFEESPVGRVIQTDDMQATSVPAVFACGDTARAAGSVTFAMADGAMAGMAAHKSLIFGEAG